MKYEAVWVGGTVAATVTARTPEDAARKVAARIAADYKMAAAPQAAPARVPYAAMAVITAPYNPNYIFAIVRPA